MWNNFPVVIPNGLSTSNLCRFDVDITPIRWRPSFDGFPRHFHIFFRCNFADRKTRVVSTYYFWCNFDGQKILVASTYFFWCNFHGQKVHVVSTYFFEVLLMVEKSTLFALTFFDQISMGKNSTSFLVSYKLMKTFEEVFLC